MEWKPILEGELAERSWSSVMTIAKELSSFTTADFSLAGGSSGIALFFHQLSLVKPYDGYEAQTERFFLHAADALANEISNATLYSGFPGVALVGHMLSPSPVSEEDPYESIDDALLSYLDEEEWTLDYDLIGGLVGLGLCAVERIQRASAQQVLSKVLSHLESLSKRVPTGITWWTSPNLLIADVRKEFPEGYYNYGLSHGVPGVIVLLARMLQGGFEVSRVRPLLDGAVAWLLSGKLEPRSASPAYAEFVGCSHFPAYAFTQEQAFSCRTAWCYGDPGVLYALWIAGKVTQNDTWKQEALRLAEFASSLTLAQAQIRDIPLCHGATGLAHIWNRLYQESGRESLRENARVWFAHSLSLLRGDGFAGVCSWALDGDAYRFKPEADFLNGAAGVGLALLGGLTQNEPQWDRALLLSIGE
jgi:lantibiotic modifying enzyme